MSTVTALFKDRTEASEALIRLEGVGFREEQISLVMTDETRGTHFGLKEGNKADEGAAAGATVGGILGAILAGIATAGVIAIPGLNLVVTGALVSGLAGLGAGAAVGGLLGGLVGAGIPEHEAKIYEKEIQRGSVLLAVKVENSEQKKLATDILKSLNAMNVAA